MRACVITITDDQASEIGLQAAQNTSRKVGNSFEVERWIATRAEEAQSELKRYGLKWTYPWERERWEEEPDLKLHPYAGSNREARIACFVSHYKLWLYCLQTASPILILEDDTLFLNRVEPDLLEQSGFGALGINDPRGATRRADVFHSVVQAAKRPFLETPWVDHEEVPQGLAGASAYIMGPEVASLAVQQAERRGAWPNDALLCKQLFPRRLGVSRTYYTKVSGKASSLATT